MWDAANVKRLTQLWSAGQSAGQIAAELRCSRSAAAAKLHRLGLHRDHKPPTAKPVIVQVPKRPGRPAHCARVPFGPAPFRKDRKELSKADLRAMFTQAVRNTGRRP
jgi:GcrA cell cycle regulator